MVPSLENANLEVAVPLNRSTIEQSLAINLCSGILRDEKYVAKNLGLLEIDCRVSNATPYILTFEHEQES